MKLLLNIVIICLFLFSCNRESELESKSDNHSEKKEMGKTGLDSTVTDFKKLESEFQNDSDLLYQYCFFVSGSELATLDKYRGELKNYGLDLKVLKEIKLRNYKDEYYFYAEIRGIPKKGDFNFGFSRYEDNKSKLIDAFEIVNIDFPIGRKALQKNIKDSLIIYSDHNQPPDTTLRTPSFKDTFESYFTIDNTSQNYFFLTFNARHNFELEEENGWSLRIEDTDTSMMEFLNMKMVVDSFDFKRYYRVHDLDGYPIPRIYMKLDDISVYLLDKKDPFRLPLTNWVFEWDGEYSGSFPFAVIDVPKKKRKEVPFKLLPEDNFSIYKNWKASSFIPGFIPLYENKIQYSETSFSSGEITDQHERTWDIEYCDLNNDSIPDMMWFSEDFGGRYLKETITRLYLNIHGKWKMKYYHIFFEM